jgi:hypothetical protein
MRFLLAFVAGVLAALVFAPVVLADGDGPTRKMTAAEASAFAVLKSGVQAALPAAPEGYTLAFDCPGGCDRFEVPETMKGNGAVWMTFVATYTAKAEDMDARIQAAFKDNVAGTPEQQARMKALEARDAELTDARDQTHDRAEKQRIRAELKAVEAEQDSLRDAISQAYEAWAETGGPQAMLQRVQDAMPAKEFTIRVLVNQRASLPDAAPAIRVPGATFAFEQTEGCQRYDECCFTCFVGPFQKVKQISLYTQYKVAEADLGVCTKPQGFEVVVSGPKDKVSAVRALAGKVNLAKLKSLLP